MKKTIVDERRRERRKKEETCVFAKGIYLLRWEYEYLRMRERQRVGDVRRGLLISLSTVSLWRGRQIFFLVGRHW